MTTTQDLLHLLGRPINLALRTIHRLDTLPARRRERGRLRNIRPIEDLRLCVVQGPNETADPTGAVALEAVRNALAELRTGRCTGYSLDEERSCLVSSLGSEFLNRQRTPDVVMGPDIHPFAGDPDLDVTGLLVAILSAPVMTQEEVERETSALADLAVLETPLLMRPDDQNTSAVVVAAPTPWLPGWSSRVRINERLVRGPAEGGPEASHLDHGGFALPTRIVVRVGTTVHGRQTIDFDVLKGRNEIDFFGLIPARTFDPMETLRALQRIALAFPA